MAKRLESGLPWGVEWWKYWFCSFFWDMEMVCTWSHKSRLSRILHFLQRCCLFPKTLYFLLSILEKKTCLYTMFLMPAMNSVLLLYILLYHMYTHIYIYIFTHTHTLTNLSFFSQKFMFLENMYLILNIHECNFQLQILHFLKSVLHPFMLFMSAFQKRTCPDWTCTALLQKMV